MLVVVSDFHFCDGTAVPPLWNVNERAVELLLTDVYLQAEKKKAKQLYLIFLGDMFDLIRTEEWLKVSETERPWSRAAALSAGHKLSAATLSHARRITRATIDCNRKALDLLSGRSTESVCEENASIAPPPGLEVHRIFIPGNHDRLYLVDPEIRKLMRQALGTQEDLRKVVPGIGRHCLRLPEYALLARHGHEWDAFNFEAHRADADPDEYTDEDYKCCPIGDPITTELVVGLPFLVRRYLLESGKFPADSPELLRIDARMKRIEDVRPLVSAFRWILYEAEHLAAGTTSDAVRLRPEQQVVLREAVVEALREVSQRFAASEFYGAWHAKHDRVGIDATELIDLVLWAMGRVSPGTLAWAAGMRDRAGLLFRSRDALCEGAMREKQLCSDYQGGWRFVIYGHTHRPLEVAMSQERPGARSAYRDVYLNSGTWRDRVIATEDQRDFVRWRQATYIMLYSQRESRNTARSSGLADPGAQDPQTLDERLNQVGPSFDTWTGSRGTS